MGCGWFGSPPSLGDAWWPAGKQAGKDTDCAQWVGRPDLPRHCVGRVPPPPLACMPPACLCLQALDMEDSCAWLFVRPVARPKAWTLMYRHTCMDMGAPSSLVRQSSSSAMPQRRIPTVYQGAGCPPPPATLPAPCVSHTPAPITPPAGRWRLARGSAAATAAAAPPPRPPGRQARRGARLHTPGEVAH